MVKIQVKKKVYLDFLGEEYEECYLTFRKIPVVNYQEIVKRLPNDDSPDEEKMNSVVIMVDTLKKYFVEGKFIGEDGKLGDVSVDDLNEIDSEVAINCFQALVGTPINPKEQTKSESTSSTDTASQ